MEQDHHQGVQALPTMLFPDIPSEALRPALSIRDYAGVYHHPGYGFVNITLDLPGSDLPLPPPLKGAINDSLYAMARHEDLLYTFSHVNGEYWIVGIRSHVHNNKVADGYSKARFRISSAGKVEGVEIVVENSVVVNEGWAWFSRVRDGEE